MYAAFTSLVKTHKCESKQCVSSQTHTKQCNEQQFYDFKKTDANVVSAIEILSVTDWEKIPISGKLQRLIVECDDSAHE